MFSHTTYCITFEHTGITGYIAQGFKYLNTQREKSLEKMFLNFNIEQMSLSSNVKDIKDFRVQ